MRHDDFKAAGSIKYLEFARMEGNNSLCVKNFTAGNYIVFDHNIRTEKMKAYSPEHIEHWRNRVGRVAPSRQARNREQASKFVEEVGFCFLHHVAAVDMPSLARATGRSHHWQLQDVMPDEREVFRGRLLLSRPMLVSREFLPYFMALTENRDSQSGWRGRVPGQGPVAHLILESLRKKSPQTAGELKSRIVRTGSAGKGAFDVALADLQITLQISAVAAGRGAQSAGFMLVRKLFASEARKARRITVEEARREILERHFRNQFMLTFAEIRRLFRWERQEIFQTLGELIRRGIVTPEVQVEGVDARTYCLLT
jgi:hypothetical protein